MMAEENKNTPMEKEESVTVEQFNQLNDKFNQLIGVVGNLTKQIEKVGSEPIEVKQSEPTKSGDEAFIDWFSNYK